MKRVTSPEEVHRQAEGLQGMAEKGQDDEDQGALGNSQGQKVIFGKGDSHHTLWMRPIFWLP